MTRRTLWTATLCLILITGAAPACSIPVFRYALERWKPSAYEVLLFHRGRLTEAEKALAGKLEQAATANVELAVLDVNGKLEDDQKAVWTRHANGALPRLVVRYPQSEEKAPDAWTGNLDAELDALLDSAARRKLVGLLTRGASAVFVVLTSSDQKADQAALDLLGRELPRLEKAVKLPEPTEEGPQLLSPIPLKVSFPVLRVSRTDPAERVFVRILLGSEDGAEEVQGPIVFPVFGRGRALCGLHGKDLNAKELEGVVQFLCGACSCQVKELNPGTDLLLAADWEEKIKAAPEPQKEEGTVTAPPIPPGKPAAREEAEVPPGGGRWLWYALGGLAILGVLAGVLARGRAPGG
jgi:hypothetical protein